MGGLFLGIAERQPFSRDPFFFERQRPLENPRTHLINDSAHGRPGNHDVRHKSFHDARWATKRRLAPTVEQRFYFCYRLREFLSTNDGFGSVAQDLIRWVPLPMRAKCKYPTNEAELEDAVSEVLAAHYFKGQVAEWHTGEQDVLKLARSVLRGLGMNKDDAKDLLRRDQWEAWLSEHGEP